MITGASNANIPLEKAIFAYTDLPRTSLRSELQLGKNRMIPLFENYQLLARNLPYVSLGEFPTPVQKLDQLGKQLGLDNLFVKRDDLSGKVYGGNKVRKLEFILGEAIRSRGEGGFDIWFRRVKSCSGYRYLCETIGTKKYFNASTSAQCQLRSP